MVKRSIPKKNQDTIETKSENEKRLNEIILQQQEEFSSKRAYTLTILIYAVPYLVLSLAIIFVQSLFVNWTIKGICLGILTVVVGALLPICFSKIKKRIQASIIKKMAKKLNNNK